MYTFIEEYNIENINFLDFFGITKKQEKKLVFDKMQLDRRVHKIDQ